MPSQRNLDGPATMPSDEDGWWENERATFVDARVEALVGPGGRIADVGCGRASLLADLTAAGRDVVRIDSHLWEEWRGRPGLFVCATADALPFAEGTFDLVGSFDVLEHLDDDSAALAEQVRVCRTGGHVVAAVPADPRLWSVHDERVGHVRRYSRRALSALGDGAGLTRTRITHFFSFLWPPAYLTRRSSVRSSEPGAGSGLAGRVVAAAVALVAGLERAWLRRGDLPLGTSLWVEWRR